MKTIAHYEDLRVPEYALSYLVNEDSSGLEPEDKAAIDAWIKPFNDEAAKAGAMMIFNVIGSDDGNVEGYFTHSPEFGLAATCCDCEILIAN